MTSAPDIEQFILRCLPDIIDSDSVRTLDPQASFFDYGLDSLASVKLTAQLSEFLRRYVSTEMILEHSTPRRLAEFLAGLPFL
jgi:acyl carrier protein